MDQEITFLLKQIVYPNIYFEFNPQLPGGSFFNLKAPFNFAIDINGEIIIENRNIYCKLYSKVKLSNNEFDDIARMQVIVTGFFETQREPDESLIKNFSVNLYAILFPFLRQATNDIMLKNGIYFIMPIMNVASIVKNNENCFIIKRK